MLRYISCDGTWRFEVLLGVSSTVLQGIEQLGVMLVLPPTTNIQTVSVAGSMSTGGKNRFGERECHHLHADGDLAYIGGSNIMSNVVMPFTDVPNLSILKTTYKYNSSGLKVKSFCGPVFYGSLGAYHWSCPSRFIGTAEYRNITYDVSPISANIWTMTFKYDWLKRGVWTTMTTTSTVEIDPVAKKSRYKSGSSWMNWYNFQSFYYSTTGSGTRVISSPRDLPRLATTLSAYFVDRDIDYWGDLSVRCADSARSVDMNSLEYLRDLGNVVEDGKKLYSLLKGKVSLKTISQLYLSYKYGYRLTLSDTISLGHDLAFLARSHHRDQSIVKAASTSTQQAGVIQRNDIYHMKIFYKKHSNEFLQGLASLQSVGLFPSPKTVWELIPFTFVVDWFTNMSSSLNALDADLTWSTHHVYGTTISVKKTYSGIPPSFFGLEGYSGSGTFTSYTRMTPDTCVRPEYFSDAPREFNNYVELTALILANRRR